MQIPHKPPGNQDNQPVVLAPHMIAKIKKKAKESLYFFAKWVCGYSKLNRRIHRPICKLLEDWAKRRVKITLPRGWYKSTLVNAFMIWAGCCDPNIRMLVVMNTHNNAITKLSSIDAHFKQNQIIRTLFPEVLPDDGCTWTQESKCLRRESAWPESTYEAAGTRTKVVSRHYDVIIEDDTVSPDLDEITEDNMLPTKEDIGQAIGWHKLANPLLTDLKTARIIVIGTRWFEKDLLSWIDENEGDIYHSYNRAATEDPNGAPSESGEPSFPEEFPADILDALKKSMGPYMYSCLYMNTPIRSGDMLFQPEWFSYYDVLPKSNNLFFYTTVDPGGDPEETMGEPDWNVVCTCAKDMRTGIIYVVEISRGKWNPGQLIESIFQHIELYKPMKVGIEAVQYQKSLMYYVKEKLKAEKKIQVIEPIQHQKRSKNSRIMGLQPLFANGHLLIRTTHEALRNELLTFPYGKHDDMADALSMQLTILPRTTGEVIKNKKELANGNDGITLDWAIKSLTNGRTNNIARHGPIGDLLDVKSSSLSTVSQDMGTRFFNKRKLV